MFSVPQVHWRWYCNHVWLSQSHEKSWIYCNMLNIKPHKMTPSLLCKKPFICICSRKVKVRFSTLRFHSHRMSYVNFFYGLALTDRNFHIFRNKKTSSWRVPLKSLPRFRAQKILRTQLTNRAHVIRCRRKNSNNISHGYPLRYSPVNVGYAISCTTAFWRHSDLLFCCLFMLHLLSSAT